MQTRYKEMGARIKEARLKKQMTQAQLAEAVDVGNTHISHIENVKTVPSLEVIIKIMDLLNVEPNYIFSGYVETTKANLLRETEMILEGCDSRQIRKLNKQLAQLKRIEVEEDI